MKKYTKAIRKRNQMDKTNVKQEPKRRNPKEVRSLRSILSPCKHQSQRTQQRYCRIVYRVGGVQRSINHRWCAMGA